MSDLIERDKVLDQLCLNHKDVIYIDKNERAKRIMAIPSARPKGEWIFRLINPLNGKFLCSECGKGCGTKTDFCPNCGSDNREREGE